MRDISIMRILATEEETSQTMQGPMIDRWWVVRETIQNELKFSSLERAQEYLNKQEEKNQAIKELINA